MSDVKEMNDPTLQIGDTVRMQYAPKYNYGWISVKDKLPENKQIVLVIDQHKEMAVCKTDITNWEYFFMLFQTSHQITKVTHWQPLPEPPNE